MEKQPIPSSLPELETAIRAAISRNNLTQYQDEKTLSRFYSLAQTLIESSAVINLTSIVDPDGIAVKHIADSLLAAAFIPQNSAVIDIGCGGGFPILPLAIAREDCCFTGLDSTAKKLDFVKNVARLLKLENVATTSARAEEASAPGAIHRERYDVVVARGVARLDILAEICLPFVKPGGVFIAMKGAEHQAELDEASTSIKTLGGEIRHTKRTSLLCADGTEMTRGLIIIKKTKHTPQPYPRKWAQIQKKPL